MALSTLELVADSPSASSVRGASGACLVFVSASGPGLGAWLVEARLATSPDVVRRALFFLKKARALVCLEGIKPGNKTARHTVALVSRSGPHFFSACWALQALVGQSLQARHSTSRSSPAKLHWYTVIKNKHGWIILKVVGLRSRLLVRLEVVRDNRP